METVPNPDICPPNQPMFHSRRDFIKIAALAGCLPLLTPTAFASIFSDEPRPVSKREIRHVYSLGTLLARQRRSLVAHHDSKSGRHHRSGICGIAEALQSRKFDARAFVDLARSAGQQYMVFTTKHHDGFCMFDSSYTNYKITNTPYGKDIVQQLSSACKEAGMPLGFYYSPPDMHHPAFRDTSKPASTNWNGEPVRPEWPLTSITCNCS